MTILRERRAFEFSASRLGVGDKMNGSIDNRTTCEHRKARPSSSDELNLKSSECPARIHYRSRPIGIHCRAIKWAQSRQATVDVNLLRKLTTSSKRPAGSHVPVELAHRRDQLESERGDGGADAAPHHQYAAAPAREFWISSSGDPVDGHADSPPAGAATSRLEVAP